MSQRASLLRKVEDSVREGKKAGFIKLADESAIALAKDYARLIDGAYRVWEDEYDIEPLNKALAVSGSHLNKLMASLGLTPLARGELVQKAGDDDEIGGLKARRGKPPELKIAR